MSAWELLVFFMTLPKGHEEYILIGLNSDFGVCMLFIW